MKVTISREGANPVSILSDKKGSRIISRESGDILEDIKKDYVKSKNFKLLLPKQISNQKFDKSVSQEYKAFNDADETVVGKQSDKFINNLVSDSTVRKIADYAINKIRDDMKQDDEIFEVIKLLASNGYIKSDKNIPSYFYFSTLAKNKEDTFPQYFISNLVCPFELDMNNFAKFTGIDAAWCKAQQERLEKMCSAYKDNDATRVKDLKDEYGKEYDKVCAKFVEFYNTFIGKLFSVASGVYWPCWGDYADYLDKNDILKFINGVAHETRAPFLVAPWDFSAAKFKNGELYRRVEFNLSYWEDEVFSSPSKSNYFLTISKVYKCTKTGMFGTGIQLERDGKVY